MWSDLYSVSWLACDMHLGDSAVVWGLYLFFFMMCVNAEGQCVVNCYAQNYPSTLCPFPPNITTLDLTTALKKYLIRISQVSEGWERSMWSLLKSVQLIMRLFKTTQSWSNWTSQTTGCREFQRCPFETPGYHQHVQGNSPRTSVWQSSKPPHSEAWQTSHFFLQAEHFPRTRWPSSEGISSCYWRLDGIRAVFEKLTLELKMWQHTELMKSVIDDIANPTKRLNLLHVDLKRSEKLVPLSTSFENSQDTSVDVKNVSTNSVHSCEAVVLCQALNN